ncbi:hypothetical protein F3087_26600 [Nocardia colli]|uniref:Uncharacterized protein n=1 Tax=Nocardia colli TaxID=2545717 RepID=A0A5N0E9R2_9NOCA|nr:hypothetical protein [Nocardia colli]KAA8886167.1 hypothetical protein F3087_26600 [Nocardia colli]
MSTEYERTVHSGKSTDEAPLSEREAQSSWHEDEAARTTGEAETGLAEEHSSTTSAEQASKTDLDVEPEHVSTTEYDAEPDRATSANAGAGAATTADYEAQPAETAAADYDYDARPTAEEDQATTTAVDTEADQYPTADPATPASNGAEQQHVSLDDVETPLFAEADLDRLRSQWREVQGAFVDSPRDAVTQADKIVSDIIYQLTTVYAERKRVLEERSAGLQESDTEDLRQALRGYRGFFRRLLSIES